MNSSYAISRVDSAIDLLLKALHPRVTFNEQSVMLKEAELERVKNISHAIDELYNVTGVPVRASFAHSTRKAAMLTAVLSGESCEVEIPITQGGN